MKSYILIAVSILLYSSMQSCTSSEVKKVSDKDSNMVTTVTKPSFILQKGLLSATLIIPGELTSFQQVDLYAKK